MQMQDRTDDSPSRRPSRARILDARYRRGRLRRRDLAGRPQAEPGRGDGDTRPDGRVRHSQTRPAR